MVNDLKKLLRDNVADAPTDHLDVASLVDAGRRRVRVRRAGVVGGATLLVAGVVAVAAVGVPNGSDDTAAAKHPPAPDAPTISLADAQRAVEGRDFEVLAKHTNRNLDRDNGQYLDGVTDDGMLLFRDGPSDGTRWRARYALMDPATGDKDWLPDPGLGQTQTLPVELSTDRLVLLAYEFGSDGATSRADELAQADLTAHVFDRGTRTWSTMTWPRVPGVDYGSAVLGPDDRLYVLAPATQGKVPEGGWPTGNGGEADDSNADGDTFHLWSVSLSDANDVRDEDLTVGDLAFTDSSMVWTDSSNGAAGLVHVRDLATGDEHSFDPHTGDRCNLLSFGASGERIVMSQYCGDYPGDVRDDRVQILTTDGDQVATLQDSGVEGYLPAGGDVVVVTAFRADDDPSGGSYVYDLATDRFLRISDAVSNWGAAGAPADQFFWHTPVNHRHGATQWLGRLLD